MAPLLSQEQRIEALCARRSGKTCSCCSRFDASEGISEQFEFRVEAVSGADIQDLNKVIGEQCSS